MKDVKSPECYMAVVKVTSAAAWPLAVPLHHWHVSFPQKIYWRSFPVQSPQTMKKEAKPMHNFAPKNPGILFRGFSMAQSFASWDNCLLPE